MWVNSTLYHPRKGGLCASTNLLLAAEVNNPFWTCWSRHILLSGSSRLKMEETLQILPQSFALHFLPSLTPKRKKVVEKSPFIWSYMENAHRIWHSKRYQGFQLSDVRSVQNVACPGLSLSANKWLENLAVPQLLSWHNRMSIILKSIRIYSPHFWHPGKHRM